MEWVETTAPNVEAAKDAALDRLGVDAQEAEFEVLEEAQKGWFGRVKSEARVRARIKPTTPRPKQERRDRKGSNKNRSKGNQKKGGGQNRGGNNNRNNGGGNQNQANKQGGGNRSGGGQKAAGAGAAAVAGGAAMAATSSNDDSNVQQQPQGQQGAQSAQGQQQSQDAKASGDGNQRNQRNKGNKGNKKMHNESDMSVADQADVAKTFMEGLVAEMGLTGTVGIENVMDDEATVQVAGDGVGLLVGPGGRTLQSLQELSRTVIQRHAGGSPNGRIRIDVGGYRAKRKEALVAFVGKVAADVVESGQAKSLEPMGSQDRKIAHDAATDIAGVSTTSEGEEPRRRVVIVPAD